jgi:hypothetical protein
MVSVAKTMIVVIVVKTAPFHRGPPETPPIEYYPPITIGITAAAGKNLRVDVPRLELLDVCRGRIR